MDKAKILRELADVINRNSMENECRTPDYILAEYLFSQYEQYCKAVKSTASVDPAMVEYITKEQVMENYENAYYSAEDMQEFRYYFETFIGCITSADVVERSKINKATENIKQDMIAHSGTGEEVIQAYCDGLKKALEYLENIGE